MDNTNNIDDVVNKAIKALESKGDLESFTIGQVINELFIKSQGDAQKLLSAMQDLAEMITEQRHSIAQGLNLPMKEAQTLPASMDARDLVDELLDLVRDTHKKWGEAAKSTDLELANRLEKYATMQMPKADMLEQLASVPVKRWDLMSGVEQAVEDEPEYTLNVKLDRECGQLYVDMTPKGRETPDQTEGMPQISVTFEVNNGLPCAHVHGDIYGDLAMSLFGRPGARLASRPGDAPVDYEDSSYSPNLSEVIASIKEPAGSGTGSSEDIRARGDRMR